MTTIMIISILAGLITSLIQTNLRISRLEDGLDQTITILHNHLLGRNKKR